MPLPLIAALIVYQSAPYHIKPTSASRTSQARVEKALNRGIEIVQGYFGSHFPDRFEVVIAPRRVDFDREVGKRWKMSPSQKWMVGAGAAEVLLLLSPDRWKEEAIEHDGSSDKELNDIVAHELVHVYHAQVCPKHDFDGMDELGWFVEGLAVRVSGQLESSHRGVAGRAIREELAPKTLADAWSGKYRYGVAGSMVKFVESKWGKKTVLVLLKAISNADALKRLDTTEGDFLRDWRSWVANEGK